MRNKVFAYVEQLLKDIESSQEENIEKVSDAVCETIINGGIIQAYGSGHSRGGALELTHRAGGFIPSKCIVEPSGGKYEGIEGVGTNFMKRSDVRKEDIVFIISNSGRNPLPIEIAIESKKRGAITVCVTALEASKHLKSKHSSGKNLYEICDYVLDNRVIEGDASIDVNGMDSKVIGMSSIATNVLLEAVVLRAIEKLVSKGIIPPTYKSKNIDGGQEYNEKLEEQYKDRFNRV